MTTQLTITLTMAELINVAGLRRAAMDAIAATDRGLPIAERISQAFSHLAEPALIGSPIGELFPGEHVTPEMYMADCAELNRAYDDLLRVARAIGAETPAVDYP